MTRNSALQIVTETINAVSLEGFNAEQRAKIADALEVIANMRDQLAKRKDSDKVKENRKAKAAAARTAAIKDVLPIVRETIKVQPDMTAKEIYAACAEQLPEEWNAAKVQYLLLHELADELVKVEVKGKANVYHIA